MDIIHHPINTEPSMRVILHKFVCSVKNIYALYRLKNSSTVRKVNNIGKILPKLNCTDIRNLNSNIPSKLKVNPPLSPKTVLPIHNRRPALLHHLVQPIFVARKTIRQTKHADSKLMEWRPEYQIPLFTILVEIRWIVLCPTLPILFLQGN